MVRGCTTSVRSKGRVPQLPRTPSLRPGYGAVVGTLADSGGALPHFPILAVVPGDDPLSPHASATPDSVGGFAFDTLPPGRYRLFVRAFGHRPDSTNVDVTAGRVDTVRIMLRVFECVK
ncbi:MAG TPA: carboxypeptidase-like regulatory domain-containing protein [Chloroflexota bacterium]